MRRLLHYFFAVRPVVLIPVWGFSILGFLRARTIDRGTLSVFVDGKTQALEFIWMLIFSGAVAAVYIMNSIADRRVDKGNAGFPLLVKANLNTTGCWFVAGIFTALSVVLPLFYSQRTLALLSLAALALGSMYSFRPFYFSGRPVMDFITNAAGYGIVAFGVGWHLAGGSLASFQFVKASLPYALLMCAGSISSTLPDRAGDKACGKITTAVAFGILPAHALAAVCVTAALIISIFLRDRLAFFGALGALPLYLAFFVFRSQKFMEATYKVGGAVIMVLAAFFFKLFFVAGLAVFIATWLYFRLLHGVNYPSLLPALPHAKK